VSGKVLFTPADLVHGEEEEEEERRENANMSYIYTYTHTKKKKEEEETQTKVRKRSNARAYLGVTERSGAALPLFSKLKKGGEFSWGKLSRAGIQKKP
jgi:hypothetical protein